MSLQTKTMTFGQYSTEPYGILTVVENSTSTANNTSSLSITLTLKRQYSISSTATKTASCTIDGTTYTWSGTVGGSGDLTLISKTQTVAHNTDGTKTINISATINFGSIKWNYTNRTLGTKSGSDTMTLTPIPRYATVTESLSSKTETTLVIAWTSDATIDQLSYSTNNGSTWSTATAVNATSGTFTISGLSANTTYNVKVKARRKDSGLETTTSALSVTTYDYPYCSSMPNFSIGDALTLQFYNPLGRSMSVYFIGNNVELANNPWTISGTSYTGFNASTTINNLYATIPNARSATYKIRVVYGSSTITKTGGTYTAKAADCTPTITGLVYQDTNSTTTSVTGDNQKIVQNKSTVRYTASGIGAKNSASVSSVRVSVNGGTVNLTVSGTTATGGTATINSGSNVTATATVTDSRGFTATRSVTVQMLPYGAATAIITAKRLRNYYASTTIKAEVSFPSVNGGNSITIGYTIVPVGSGTVPATVSGSLTNNTAATVSLDNKYVWTMTVTVTDTFGTVTTFTKKIPRGLPLIFFDRKRNSIGYARIPANDNAMDVFTMCQATGASNTATAISSGTITQVPLVSTGIIQVGDGFSIDDGGIKVDNAGTYRISASCYMRAVSNGGAYDLGIFIRTGTSYATSSEIMSGRQYVDTTGGNVFCVVNAAPKLVELTANDIVYLTCRSQGGNGSFYAGNSGTYLLVERIN